MEKSELFWALYKNLEDETMNMRNFMATLQRLKYVAILNKNQQIYPTELIES